MKEARTVNGSRAHLELVEASARTGLAGGVIYDALIAATVRHAGATLLTTSEPAPSTSSCGSDTSSSSEAGATPAAAGTAPRPMTGEAGCRARVVV